MAAGDAAKQIANAQAEVTAAEADVAEATKKAQDALDQAQKVEDQRQAAVKAMTLRMDQLQSSFNKQLKQAETTIEVKDNQIAAEAACQ